MATLTPVADLKGDEGPRGLPGEMILVQQAGTWAGAVTVTWDQPTVLHVTLIGPTVLTLPTPDPEWSFTVQVKVKQDPTGSRTLTVKGAVAAFGVPVTLSTAANALDDLLFTWDGVRWTVRVGGLSDSTPTSWIV